MPHEHALLENYITLRHVVHALGSAHTYRRRSVASALPFYIRACGGSTRRRVWSASCGVRPRRRPATCLRSSAPLVCILVLRHDFRLGSAGSAGSAGRLRPQASAGSAGSAGRLRPQAPQALQAGSARRLRGLPRRLPQTLQHRSVSRPGRHWRYGNITKDSTFNVVVYRLGWGKPLWRHTPP